MNNTELMRQRPSPKAPKPAIWRHPGIKYAYQWMMIAYIMREASTAVRRKVGAAIVTPSMGVFTGYNGTPPGEDNCCEYETYFGGDTFLTTKPNVIHAEQNAINKMFEEKVDTRRSVIFITLSPCENCAQLLIDAGVSAVYYHKEYRCLAGVDRLRQAGMVVGTWGEVLGTEFRPIDTADCLENFA